MIPSSIIHSINFNSQASTNQYNNQTSNTNSSISHQKHKNQNLITDRETYLSNLHLCYNFVKQKKNEEREKKKKEKRKNRKTNEAISYLRSEISGSKRACEREEGSGLHPASDFCRNRIRIFSGFGD